MFTDISEPISGDDHPQSTDSFLDDLIHQKSRIAASKLEVIAAAMVARVDLLAENLQQIEKQQTQTQQILTNLDSQARYRLREHRDKTPLYQLLHSLAAEKRTQGSDCWRDIVRLLELYLGVGEAHQQAQARATFLQGV